MEKTKILYRNYETLIYYGKNHGIVEKKLWCYSKL